MLTRMLFSICVLFTHLGCAYEYEIAICAIFKDEGPYLKEWIEFHKLVGVQHFYLYNHHSEDLFLDVLQPYIDKGEVTLWNTDVYQEYDNEIIYDFNSLQCQAYTDAAKKLTGIVKWLAFLDIDEFLFPTKAFYLKDVLKDYGDCVGIGINWQMFGTSRIEKIPDNKLLIETLIYCAPTNYTSNIHVKSIVKPQYVVSFTDPHAPTYTPGNFQVNTDKVPFSGPFSPYVKVDKLRINHYWTRDEYYLRNNKIVRRQKWGDSAENVLKINNEINQKLNAQIMKYVPFLRTRLKSSIG